MVEIGKINTLTVVKRGAQGGHLDGGALGDILLPQNELPLECGSGDTIEVFIYRDDKGRIIATTKRPYAQVGQFAFLQVTGLHAAGAFLDWGLPKDLLVPLREQNQKMAIGGSYIVYVYLDEKKGRITASTKIEKYLDTGMCFYDDGQAVDLLIYDRTEIGYKAIINDTFSGVLFQSEVFQTVTIGQHIQGFIKHVREDGKIDLCLHQPGYAKIDPLSKKILDAMKAHGGFIAVTDKSAPEAIYALFGISKKTYKKAIGALYKKRLITIEESGIRLTDKNTPVK
ncbi:MAG: S1-like domain-containing RNA-binding protein [Syntrophaceae bacterium]